MFTLPQVPNLQEGTLFLLCVICALLVGCGRLAARRATPAPATLSPGDVTRALTHAGRERSYLVHIPPGYDPARPAPVVLVLHGGLGNAENTRKMTGFDAVADAKGFIVVYPNGTGRLQDWLLTWNGRRCCSYVLEQNVDDVGFVCALLTIWERWRMWTRGASMPPACPTARSCLTAWLASWRM